MVLDRLARAERRLGEPAVGAAAGIAALSVLLAEQRVGERILCQHHVEVGGDQCGECGQVVEQAQENPADVFVGPRRGRTVVSREQEQVVAFVAAQP
jgi:hypothetical protein